jgi:hypothetical protein
MMTPNQRELLSDLTMAATIGNAILTYKGEPLITMGDIWDMIFDVAQVSEIDETIEGE